MEAIIKDIREKIHNNYYLNEEHIRLNLVIRILQTWLGNLESERSKC